MGLASRGRLLLRNGLQLASKVAKAAERSPADQPLRSVHSTGAWCVSGSFRGSMSAPYTIQPAPSSHAIATTISPREREVRTSTLSSRICTAATSRPDCLRSDQIKVAGTMALTIMRKETAMIEKGGGDVLWFSSG